MGRVLQVRVWAQTYDPDEMAREWPTLVALAWPEKEDGPGPFDNVQELVRAFSDRRRFGGWDENLRNATGEGAAEAAACLDELEAALGDWDPVRASKLTDRLEDGLDALEKTARDLVQRPGR